MCSEKQLAANRANARKSTGPRSKEGKLVVAQNAAKHGLTGADVVMPDEDPQPFEELRKQLEADLGPQGPVQRLLFDRIVSGAWRLRRAHLVERGLYTRNSKYRDEEETDYFKFVLNKWMHACETADALGKLARYENSIERGMHKAMRELWKLQATDRAAGAGDLMAKDLVEQEKIAKQTQNPVQLLAALGVAPK